MKLFDRFLEAIDGSLVALVAEGGVETAVLEKLIDDGYLIIPKDRLISGEVISLRKGEKLEKYIQGFDYQDEKLTLVRVLDSKNEKYIPTRWGQVHFEDRIFNVLTRPEIEMLYIFGEEKLHDYENYVRQKRGTKNSDKPSTFCKEYLFHNSNFKSRRFAEGYFSDSSFLIEIIREYHQKRNKGDELDLSCLLK